MGGSTAHHEIDRYGSTLLAMSFTGNQHQNVLQNIDALIHNDHQAELAFQSYPF